MMKLSLPDALLATRLRGLLPLVVLALVIGSVSAPIRAQSDDVVAVVNGRRISQREVDETIAAQLLPLQQQIEAMRRKALDNLVVRAILDDEAKKRGISVEELQQQLTTGRIDVSPSQVEQLYLENASAFAAMSPDEAKQRLRLDLESQERMKKYREALAKLRGAATIEVRAIETKLAVRDLDAAPSIGPKGAPVTIVEFSDFECSFCKRAHSTIKKVLESHGANVRLIFKHMPLTDTHPLALPAAQASFCAGEQNRFWQYKDALFALDTLSNVNFTTLAARLGLDVRKFDVCVASERARAAVIRDLQEGKRIGISGTPAFVINGRLVRGAMGYEEFKDIIEREIRSAQRAPPSP